MEKWFYDTEAVKSHFHGRPSPDELALWLADTVLKEVDWYEIARFLLVEW